MPLTGGSSAPSGPIHRTFTIQTQECPEYLSAAVLYESMVVESYSQSNLPFPVVAIYPKEGTFWSDHPVGVVEREWVTPEHREAGKIYIQYLLARPQQERAMEYGFRPASLDVPLAAPLDSNHGIDSKEPKTTLEVPSVMSSTKETFKRRPGSRHLREHG